MIRSECQICRSDAVAQHSFDHEVGTTASPIDTAAIAIIVVTMKATVCTPSTGHAQPCGTYYRIAAPHDMTLPSNCHGSQNVAR
jgi:hypothetical protein